MTIGLSINGCSQSENHFWLSRRIEVRGLGSSLENSLTSCRRRSCAWYCKIKINKTVFTLLCSLFKNRWMGGCIWDRAASYSPPVHGYSCKIYKLKLNNYVAGFWKTLLLSLSYKLFFSFFCSLVFGLMGCKKGILVFTSLKLHAPIIIKYVFVSTKNNGLPTGNETERRIVLMHFLLK